MASESFECKLLRPRRPQEAIALLDMQKNLLMWDLEPTSAQIRPKRSLEAATAKKRLFRECRATLLPYTAPMVSSDPKGHWRPERYPINIISKGFWELIWWSKEESWLNSSLRSSKIDSYSKEYRWHKESQITPFFWGIIFSTIENVEAQTFGKKWICWINIKKHRACKFVLWKPFTIWLNRCSEASY